MGNYFKKAGWVNKLQSKENNKTTIKTSETRQKKKIFNFTPT